MGGLIDDTVEIGGDLYHDVAGVADHIAGSTDETVGRTLEDFEAGDFDGVGDNLAGPLDEGANSVVNALTDGVFQLGSGTADAAEGVASATGTTTGTFLDELGATNAVILAAVVVAAVYVGSRGTAEGAT